MRQWIIIITTLSLLSACGVKGRLYHPEDPPTHKPLFSDEGAETDPKKNQGQDQAPAPESSGAGDKNLNIENTGIGHSGADMEPGNK